MKLNETFFEIEHIISFNLYATEIYFKLHYRGKTYITILKLAYI